MRNISIAIAKAFNDRRTKSLGNSHTDGEGLYLHGHKIAFWDEDHNGEILSFSMCGWGTVTTRERLNSLFHVLGFGISIKQKNHEQVLMFKGKNIPIGDLQQVNFHTDLNVITFGSKNISLPKYEAIKQGWLENVSS
tara:strand:+ start:577 stop:987 length:411 start_codon:yes stop_codon:yes gene_type:complete